SFTPRAPARPIRMTVNQVRSLFLTSTLERNRHANARSAYKVFNEAVVSVLCRAPCCAWSPLDAQVTPTSGHTCLMPGNKVWLAVPARTCEPPVIGSYSFDRAKT